MTNRRYFSEVEAALTKRKAAQSGTLSDSATEECRSGVVERIRRIVRPVVLNGEPWEHYKVRDEIRSCINALPVDDVEVLDRVTFSGKLFDQCRKAKVGDPLFLGLLAKLHDVAVIRLGRDDRWEAFVNGLEHERETNRIARRARRAQLLRDWGWQIIVVAILVWGFSEDNPYSYYVVLRFICCIVFAWWAWSSHQCGKSAWSKAFAITAIAYNPFLPLSMEREWWMVANAVTCGLAVASALVLRRIPTTCNNEEAQQDAPSNGG